MVDAEVMKILRQRTIECNIFYGAYESKTKCAKIIEDYEQATGMYVQKCK